MVEISRAETRSTAALAVSFLFHVMLIIVFALVFFDLGGYESISLNVASIDSEIETTTLESPSYSSELDDALQPTFAEPQELLMDDLLKTAVLDAQHEETFWLGESVLGDAERQATEVNLQETGFFGIEPSGQRVVYIIDMSFSMRERGYHSRRYDRAVAEVLKSVEQLRPDQTFYVYLFCFRKFEMNIGQPPGHFCAPTDVNKRRLQRWLDSVDLGSGTDPRESLVTALNRQPSCIFLLSDGEFNGVQFENGQYGNRVSAAELARLHNVNHCPIHTIGLEDRANQEVLTVIASESGGTYQFVGAQPK